MNFNGKILRVAACILLTGCFADCAHSQESVIDTEPSRPDAALFEILDNESTGVETEAVELTVEQYNRILARHQQLLSDWDNVVDPGFSSEFFICLQRTYEQLIEEFGTDLVVQFLKHSRGRLQEPTEPDPITDQEFNQILARHQQLLSKWDNVVDPGFDPQYEYDLQRVYEQLIEEFGAVLMKKYGQKKQEQFNEIEFPELFLGGEHDDSEKLWQNLQEYYRNDRKYQQRELERRNRDKKR